MKTTQKCSAFQEFVEYEIVSSRKITHWISNRNICSASDLLHGIFVLARFLNARKRYQMEAKKVYLLTLQYTAIQA